jgi:hypothetical protein
MPLTSGDSFPSFNPASAQELLGFNLAGPINGISSLIHVN